MPATRSTSVAKQKVAAASEANVTVETVRTRTDLDAFIRYQLELYTGDPYFVSPIVAERRDFFDRGKNPFFSHAEVECRSHAATVESSVELLPSTTRFGTSFTTRKPAFSVCSTRPTSQRSQLRSSTERQTSPVAEE